MHVPKENDSEQWAIPCCDATEAMQLHVAKQFAVGPLKKEGAHLKEETPACRLAEDQVAHVSAFNATVCNKYVHPFGSDLAPSCPLFARKFGPEVADKVTQILGATGLLRYVGLLSQMD